MIRPALAFALFASLGACNEPASPAQPKAGDTNRKPTSRTVLQFLEDPVALDETWGRCRNDPGGIGDTADCRNAAHAEERIMMVGREHTIEVLKR